MCKSIRKPEDRTVRFFFCPIIKDNILGRGKPDLRPPVNADILSFHIPLIEPAEIKQARVYFQRLGIIIVCTVYCIVEFQKILLIFKNFAEQPILVFPVDLMTAVRLVLI